MKCLICGKETDQQVVCSDCETKVTEELCYRVAGYNYNKPDNELWAEIITQLGYKFRALALDLAEFTDEKRRTFVKINCMNLMRSSDIGVAKSFRDYVRTYGPECENNEDFSPEERNLVRALRLCSYIYDYSWDLIDDLPDSITLDDVYLEPWLIIADYYVKVRDYSAAIKVLNEAKDTFVSGEDQSRIEHYLTDCIARNSNEKKAWKPSTREEIDRFYDYLSSLGVKPAVFANNKKRKIKESDFKPWARYEEGRIPKEYISLWITSEYYPKKREAVEINAVRVKDGRIIDRFHEFVHPINRPKKAKYVKEEDYLQAERIEKVFPRFLEFAKNDILAIAGFDEQKILLSRLARYTMMDHLDNEIFDIVEYGEDISDDYSSYTRSTLLEKYGVPEGNTGMEKAEAAVALLKKMR